MQNTLQNRINELKSTMNDISVDFAYDYTLECNSHDCIGDSFWEYADCDTDIYYSDLNKWMSENIDLMEEAVSEGFYQLDPHNFSLYSLAQCAQYMSLERELSDDMSEILEIMGIRYILDTYENITPEQWDEFEDLNFSSYDEFSDFQDDIDLIFYPDSDE